MLGVRCSGDALLHHLAPIGLAASVPTALVLDLDGSLPAYPGTVTAADLLRDGLRRMHLGPQRRGVSVLPHGGAGHGELLGLVEALAPGWPAVVVRVGVDPVPFPVVPVSVLVPGTRPVHGPAVYQALLRPVRAAVDGVVLPPLRRAQVSALLAGHLRARWRWVQSWAPVWERRWA